MKIVKLQQLLLTKGWLSTMPADQGGAVVPDGVTIHKIERPETHD